MGIFKSKFRVGDNIEFTGIKKLKGLISKGTRGKITEVRRDEESFGFVYEAKLASGAYAHNIRETFFGRATIRKVSPSLKSTRGRQIPLERRKTPRITPKVGKLR